MMITTTRARYSSVYTRNPVPLEKHRHHLWDSRVQQPQPRLCCCPHPFASHVHPSPCRCVVRRVSTCPLVVLPKHGGQGTPRSGAHNFKRDSIVCKFNLGSWEARGVRSTVYTVYGATKTSRTSPPPPPPSRCICVQYVCTYVCIRSRGSPTYWTTVEILSLWWSTSKII